MDASRRSDASQPAGTATTADPTVLLFWAFVVAHVVGWSVVPAVAQRCLPLDTIEMLYWGREWQWGYFKHPPLPAWIAEVCWLLFGSVEWPLYLVSQLCVALCFISAWRLARSVLTPWPALVAVMLLELCPFLSYTTPQWNNNGPTKPAWAFAILGLYLALTQRRWWYWPATGMALGLSLLAKYDAMLLLSSMAGFLLVHPATRWVWRTPGPVLLLAVAVAVVAPHLVWLLAGDAAPLAYVGERIPAERNWLAHLVHPLAFLGAQIGAVAAMPLLVSTVFGWHWRPVVAGTNRRFARDYLVAMVFGPPLLAAAAAAATGMKMVALWGAPMWTFFGVLLMVAAEPTGSVGQYRQLARRCMVCGLLLLITFGVAKSFHGEFAGRLRRVQYPGRFLAAEIGRRWALASQEPLRIIGGDWWLAGVVAFYDPARPHVYPELQAAWAPWVSDEDLQRDGGVLLWTGRDSPRAKGWLARFPQAQRQPQIVLEIPGIFRNLMTRIEVAVVPPQPTTQGQGSSQ